MSLSKPLRPVQALSKRVAMLTALVACVLPTMAGGAAPGQAAQAAAEIDAIVASAAAGYLAHPGTAGLSIGVLKQGERHSYHFGMLDKNKRQPPDDATIYPIASIASCTASMRAA